MTPEEERLEKLANCLVESLVKTRAARKAIEELLPVIKIPDTPALFFQNPVFPYSKRDKHSSPEEHDQEAYCYLLDQLTEAHKHLITTQKLLLRLGLHHVRFKAGKEVS